MAPATRKAVKKGIFDAALLRYGSDCFRNNTKRHKVRRMLYRYIQHQGQGHGTEAAESVAEEAINFYRTAYANGQIPGIKQKFEVLLLAAHVCQKYNVDNDHVMSDIASLHWGTERFLRHDTYKVSPEEFSMSRWFSFLSDLTPGVYCWFADTLFPYKPDFDQEREAYVHQITARHLTALEYYIKHIKTRFFRVSRVSRAPLRGYRLQVREVSFVDFPVRTLLALSTPLGLACRAAHAQAVHLLLRYGATPVLYPNGFHYDDIHGRLDEPIGILTRILNHSRTWRDCSLRAPDEINADVLEYLQDWEQREETKLLECLVYIHRAVLKLPIIFVPEQTDDEDEEEEINMDQPRVDKYKVEFYLDSRYQSIYPMSTLKSPRSLQHLCRYEIRRSLHRAGELPRAIDDLPCTHIVKDYLNLQR